MRNTGQPTFAYPQNMAALDLAVWVPFYRNRGEPAKAPAGEYFTCAYTLEFVKTARHWFGLYISPKMWDKLLTKNAKGYPLTFHEFQLMGLTLFPLQSNTERSFIEQQIQGPSQLPFMITKDLIAFGFILQAEHNQLQLTTAGEKALDGFARHVYDQNFHPEMLPQHRNSVENKKDTPSTDQGSLF